MIKLDMTNKDYHASPGINATSIKAGRKSPLHMHCEMTKTVDAPTPAMVKGTLIHMAVLEPHRLDSEIVVCDLNRNTKDLKALKAENPDAFFLKTSERKELDAIRDAALANDEAQHVLQEYDREVSLFWEGKYGKARARFDCYSPNSIVDVKSTADINPKFLASTVGKYAYHVQAGWYDEGHRQLNDDNEITFYFLWIESNPPYDVCVSELASESLALGRMEAVEIATMYRICEMEGFFPGVGADGVKLLEVPELYLHNPEVIV